MKKAMLALAVLGAPLWAQFSGFGREELIKYTPTNPYERFPDGRPKVPDGLLQRLQKASSEEVWAGLLTYRSQWVGDWKLTHPEKVLAGRVFTAQWMPARPEFELLVQPDNKSFGKWTSSNQRVIDMLQPGDALVVDLFGKIDGGVFVGDNLTRAIYLATGNGFVVNGSLRDQQGIGRIEAPVYCRGFSPTVWLDVMLTGINVPVRIGDVTVMPGDAAFGDREGVTFIPPHMLEKVVTMAEEAELHDEWTELKMNTRKYKSRDVYPVPATPELKKEYEEWRAKRKAELGLP
jgi:regulator of RNase E activity RraA